MIPALPRYGGETPTLRLPGWLVGWLVTLLRLWLREVHIGCHSFKRRIDPGFVRCLRWGHSARDFSGHLMVKAFLDFEAGDKQPAAATNVLDERNTARILLLVKNLRVNRVLGDGKESTTKESWERVLRASQKEKKNKGRAILSNVHFLYQGRLLLLIHKYSIIIRLVVVCFVLLFVAGLLSRDVFVTSHAYSSPATSKK